MRKNAWKIITSILLIFTGIVLLLSNLSIISLEMKWSWENIYPVLLVGLGLKIWFDAIVNQGGSWILGSLLTVFGGFLILDRFGLFTFSFHDIWHLWPLLFIYIGFSVFLGKKRSNIKVHYDSDEISSKGKHPKSMHMAIGDHSFNKDNWRVEPMDLWNGIGDYKFDFTRAFIPDEDTPIIVRGWIGDVKMIIPKHVPFRVDAKVKTGDIKVAGQTADGLNRMLLYETDDYAAATRRLTIYIAFAVGTVKVDQV